MKWSILRPNTTTTEYTAVLAYFFVCLEIVVLLVRSWFTVLKYCALQAPPAPRDDTCEWTAILATWCVVSFDCALSLIFIFFNLINWVAALAIAKRFWQTVTRCTLPKTRLEFLPRTQIYNQNIVLKICIKI